MLSPETARTPVPAGLILLFLGIAAVIFTGGSLFYQAQEEEIRGQVTGDLASIAYLKAGQIAAWRGERLGDAAVLSANPILVAGVKEYLSSPDPEERERILRLFRQINTSYRYRNVRLLDPAGRVAVTLDPRETGPDPLLAGQVAGAVAEGEPVLTDLMPGPDTKTPALYVIAPLSEGNDNRSKPVGAIVLTIDPATDLYPLVQSWPVPSASAETLLVERQGDHVLFLNTLRHRNDTALNLTIPLTRTDVPAVQAIMGTTGQFTGTDYRNIEVLSVLVPVRESPWFMVAKIDTAEAYASWRSRAGFIIVLVAGTLVSAAIIAALLWQRRQKYFYRSLYAAESTLREEEEKGHRALEASERRLRRFYDSGLFGVIFWNMDGKITDANDTFLAMTGYTREDLGEGRIDWGSMTPPEFRHRDEESVAELKATGRNAVPFEKEYIRKDGSRLPVLLAGAMLDEQKYDGVAFVLDISALKRARASLAAEQQRYRELFDNVPVGMSRSTPGPGARILAANPADLRIFGAASPEELLAAAPESLYADPDDRRRFVDELEKSGSVTGREIRFRTVQGKEFWGRISARRYIAEDGSVFFDNVVEDISAQKVAEQALRESERKFRILFTSMIEGSALHEILYGPAGEPAEYRILDVNPAYERILGIGRGEAVGRTSREVYRVESPPFLETYARVAATGVAETFEVYFPPLQKHFSVSVFSPEPGKFATIFEDITGRKQAEAQREALIRELEKKNAELERFTYTVSHDLKSPLITIKGFAGLLEDDARKCDPELLKKDVKRITDAADTMQQLLTDVLELSRVGRIIAPPRPTGFGEIVREAAGLLAGPLGERGVVLEIAPDLPTVNVDHARIREVLVNLLENAIKFMGDQKNPVIRIGVTPSDRGPVFFVQDNGSGIDPRYLARVFNLFEKLDPSVPGTGMGLTIVKRIIEVHGGTIWAESEGPGKGTTFRFTLPVPPEGSS